MNAKVKINLAIIVTLFVIGGLFFLGKAGVSVLSGLRAYVGAEGLWAKKQKEATFHLAQYMLTRENNHYLAFKDSLKVPLGDKVARLELQKTSSDHEIIFKGFIDGGNNPEDIPMMIFLYDEFKNNKNIGKAIEQWEVGDKLIEELIKTGEEIHQLITNEDIKQEQVLGYMATIQGLEGRLYKAEYLFSDNISVAARWTSKLLLVIMFAFTAIGSVICFFMLRLIADINSDLNNKNEQLKVQKRILDRSQEIASLGSWHLDIKKNILTWSDEEYRIFGRTPQEFGATYEAFLETIHPDDREMVDKTYSNAINNKLPYECVHRIIKKDGKERVVLEKSEDIVDENGNTIHSFGFTQDITEQKLAEQEREKIIEKLQKSLDEIKTLRGILPICSFCKNIRNDDGYYEQIEAYIHKHSGVDFSHTICPKCMEKHYPEEYKRMVLKKKD